MTSILTHQKQSKYIKYLKVSDVRTFSQLFLWPKEHYHCKLCLCLWSQNIRLDPSQAFSEMSNFCTRLLGLSMDERQRCGQSTLWGRSWYRHPSCSDTHITSFSDLKQRKPWFNLLLRWEGIIAQSWKTLKLDFSVSHQNWIIKPAALSVIPNHIYTHFFYWWWVTHNTTKSG